MCFAFFSEPTQTISMKLARTDVTPRPDWTGSYGFALSGRSFGPCRETPPTLPCGFVLVEQQYQCCKGRRERVATFVGAEKPEPRDLALARQGVRRQLVGGGS